MRITIENIAPAFHPFIDEIESGNGDVGIWLKEGYVFTTTGAACTFFTYDDYRNSRYPEYQLEQAIDKCLADELIQITVGAWQKQSQPNDENIVSLNPAKLFRSGIPK